jgi:DNA-binding transcriptional ArsR family regulator
LNKSRQIEVIIDGKHLMSKGQRVDLRVDGKKVYSTENCLDTNFEIGTLDWTVVEYFLKIASSAFGHVDRFRIMRCLAESPKSFSEIKELLKTQSPTVNFHLKTLSNEALILKNENGKYALALMGELILNYFSDFLKEASCLNDVLVQQTCDVKK